MGKVALLIGISDYEPGLNPLPTSVNDLRTQVETNSKMTLKRHPQTLSPGSYHLFYCKLFFTQSLKLRIA